MTFSETFSFVQSLLARLGTNLNGNNAYDGIIIKRLEASNTLDSGRTTNQTHIAITGQQMDIFPYLCAEGYFSPDYEHREEDLKKYFITQVPVWLYKSNVDYLYQRRINESADSIVFNESHNKRVTTSIIRSRRNDQADQVQMSLIDFDHPDFVRFRRLINIGDYLLVLKRKNLLEYEFYAVKNTDSSIETDSLGGFNNCFYRQISYTTVDITEILPIRDTAVKYLPDSLRAKRNRIIFGAPGTGKSRLLVDDQKKYFDDTHYERVTFHQNYSFAQFVGTYKPVPTDDGNITYKYVPGPFIRVLIKAIQNPEECELLIIEEINRANAAAVFGNVFQLLDRKDGVSEYPIETSEDLRNYLSESLGDTRESFTKISIPANMYIWATMNSADQGVFPIDTAFKRRWDFEYIGINQGSAVIADKFVEIAHLGYRVQWDIFRREINRILIENCGINEDKLIGPFFLGLDMLEDADKFNDAFKNKLLMYLFEDAARQHRHEVFCGCDDCWTFSAICLAYDLHGETIFGLSLAKDDTEVALEDDSEA